MFLARLVAFIFLMLALVAPIFAGHGTGAAQYEGANGSLHATPNAACLNIMTTSSPSNSFAITAMIDNISSHECKWESTLLGSDPPLKGVGSRFISHVHGVSTVCNSPFGTKTAFATYKGELPTNTFCKDGCQTNLSGISLGFRQGTPGAEFSSELISQGISCPSTQPVASSGTPVSQSDANKTCVIGENQGELCISRQAQNCGTVNGKAICYDSLPSGKCTFIGNGNYACDKGSTAPSNNLPIPEPGAPTPVKIGTVNLPIGVGGVGGSGGLAGSAIELYGNPTGLLPDSIPPGTPGSDSTPLSVKFPTDYAKNAPVELIKDNTKLSADKLVAIDKLLAGTGTDAAVITDKGTTSTDDLDKAFKDRHVSIDTRLSNPVGGGLDFNFAFPTASCMPLSWNVHGFVGQWNFCNEWDAVGRPALAWLFFGLTAFYLYSLFHTSGRTG